MHIVSKQNTRGEGCMEDLLSFGVFFKYQYFILKYRYFVPWLLHVEIFQSEDEHEEVEETSSR